MESKDFIQKSRDQNKEEERKIEILRNQINDFEKNLNEDQDGVSIHILENLKCSWKKQIDVITYNYCNILFTSDINEDIYEEVKNIAELFDLKLKELLKNISNFRDLKVIKELQKGMLENHQKQLQQINEHELSTKSEPDVVTNTYKVNQDQLASTELKGVAGTQHQDQLASTELKGVAGTHHQVKLASTVSIQQMLQQQMQQFQQQMQQQMQQFQKKLQIYYPGQKVENIPTAPTEVHIDTSYQGDEHFSNNYLEPQQQEQQQEEIHESLEPLNSLATDSTSIGFGVLNIDLTENSQQEQQHHLSDVLTPSSITDVKHLLEETKECNEVQKKTIDLLLDINHGKVHPALISPQQLQDEIVIIRNSLPDKFVSPGRHTGTELKKIWPLLSGKGIFVGNQLVIDLKIPLFSRQVSQYYRIIPVPFERNGRTLIAQVKAPYIVYNYELDSYHFLTQAMLNECKKTLNNQTVCEENYPWIDAASKHYELSPIKPHIQLNCSYDEIEQVPFWAELRNRGNWLFKVYGNTSAHIKCSNQEQKIMQLPQQGIFTLDADCTARIDMITLLAVHTSQSKLKNQFHHFLTKDVNLDDKDIIKPLGNVIINHDNEIAQLKGQKKDIKKENIELRGLTFHHLSGHTSLLLITVVIIILAIVFIRRLMKIRKITAITFAPPQNVQV